MQELNAQEDKILSTYGWTDKPLGIVRIPIDQAMELQLKRGFPLKKEAAKCGRERFLDYVSRFYGLAGVMLVDDFSLASES